MVLVTKNLLGYLETMSNLLESHFFFPLLSSPASWEFIKLFSQHSAFSNLYKSSGWDPFPNCWETVLFFLPKLAKPLRVSYGKYGGFIKKKKQKAR